MAMNTSRILCALLLTVASNAASAAEPLSASELAECARLSLDMEQTAATLRENAAQFEADHAELDRLHADVRPMEEGGGERWSRYNRAIDAYQEKIGPLETQVEQINRQQARFAELCAGRPYNPADLEALPDAQRQAMEDGPSDISIPRIRRR
jgi:chromosome segregation ATPase